MHEIISMFITAENRKKKWTKRKVVWRLRLKWIGMSNRTIAVSGISRDPMAITPIQPATVIFVYPKSNEADKPRSIRSIVARLANPFFLIRCLFHFVYFVDFQLWNTVAHFKINCNSKANIHVVFTPGRTLQHSFALLVLVVFFWHLTLFGSERETGNNYFYPKTELLLFCCLFFVPQW